MCLDKQASTGKTRGKSSTGRLRESTTGDIESVCGKSEDLKKTGWRYLVITAIEHTFQELAGNNKEITENKISKNSFLSLEKHSKQEVISFFQPPNPKALDFYTFATRAKEIFLEKQNALEFLASSFEFFDIDGDGSVSKDDLRKAMINLHEPLTFVEVNEIVGKGEWAEKSHKIKDGSWLSTLSFLLGAQYKNNDDRKQFSVFNAMRLESETLSGAEFTNPILRLVGAKFVVYNLLRGHKIPMSHSKGEKRFLIGMTCSFILMMIISVVLSLRIPNEWGRFDSNLIVQTVFLFTAEVTWECFLSYCNIKFGVKINYTRKLGHLLRLPKYFLAQYIPGFIENPMTLLTAFILNQMIFAFLFCRASRVKVDFFSFLFQSQDRREDRPYSNSKRAMRFQITEDVLRFAIYLPFKAGLLDMLSKSSGRNLDPIIFIPIFINTVGDGLAEPVGVMFGRHKYCTKSLYYNGEWWSGSFVRSYEGSSMVFLSTVLILSFQYNLFTTSQFVFLIVLMPPFMTITEAIAPHTNDGPFLALVGCSLLAFALLVID